MSTDAEIKALRDEVSQLQQQLAELKQRSDWVTDVVTPERAHGAVTMPARGQSSTEVRKVIEDAHALDFRQELNTSSYVNVSFEDDEEQVALMGLRVNLADQTVYPESFRIHDQVVNMVAQLWHCPVPDDFDERGVYPGAGTVGSTEACLLAGLALKFRWRHWYAKHKNILLEDTLGVRPNLVISTLFQAAWEKFFRYMDVDCRLVSPDSASFKVTPEAVADAIDEHTIGVVCIMGNHYGGQYDPVWEIDAMLSQLNRERGFQVGIHVDAASGGFVAPFQDDLPPWDFRLPHVLSISSSGHKYGESCCGTGWVVWRQREDLSAHVAVSVTYLGGNAESYTLNFSRPASGVYVQYYKFLRYGREGYRHNVARMMALAADIRQHLREMVDANGTPRFVFLDDGDHGCLPVVTAMLNPAMQATYDDIDLQHVLSQYHWYVSGYKMGYLDPLTDVMEPLFVDQSADKTMFRIVVKANLTYAMIHNLVESLEAAFDLLDGVDFSSLHAVDAAKLRHPRRRQLSHHC